MKYYTFKRESNDFADILKDTVLKKHVRTKVTWNSYLMIGLSYKTKDDILGYIVLKYGEDIVNPVQRDYKPIPNIDYVPKRN